MWQRFTERARKAVFFAQEEAGKLGEGYVSTEHLLLGLLRDPGFTVKQLLAESGNTAVTPERIRAEVMKQLPRGDSRTSPDMTLTPRAKRVIDLAYDECRLMNDGNLGEGHFFLALMREGDGLAGRVLAKFGFEITKARQIVMQCVSPLGDIDSSDSPESAHEPLTYNLELAKEAAILDTKIQAAVLKANPCAEVALQPSLQFLRQAKLLSLENAIDNGSSLEEIKEISESFDYLEGLLRKDKQS